MPMKLDFEDVPQSKERSQCAFNNEYLLMLSSSDRSQLKVLNCQYFLLLPPLLAADPVGRREKLGSSLTLCSAASTPTLPSSAASAGLLISRVHCGEKLAGGHSTGLGPAGLPTTAARLHYTAFLNFPLRASNSLSGLLNPLICPYVRCNWVLVITKRIYM